MQHRMRTLALMALSLCITPALAGGEPAERMLEAVQVISDFTAIPEQAIPSSLLNNAYGVAVIPGVIKLGLGLGGRYGTGVLTVRRDDGSWSNPVFIRLGGGSIGWQFGLQSTDLVLVFKDRRSINNIAEGKLTIGGEASAAAGPLGRQASAATDGRLDAEIYSYSRNRGLFAGVALDGAWLGMDESANSRFYGPGRSALQILDDAGQPAHQDAQQLLSILSRAAPGIRQASATGARKPAQATGPRVGTAPPAEVRTYGLEPMTGDGDETLF